MSKSKQFYDEFKSVEYILNGYIVTYYYDHKHKYKKIELHYGMDDTLYNFSEGPTIKRWYKKNL